MTMSSGGMSMSSGGVSVVGADGGGDASSSATSVSQSTARTKFSAMSKGKAAISETSADGRFIKIENKGQATLDLGGWSVERCVDMGDVIKFTFAAGTNLNGFATMT